MAVLYYYNIIIIISILIHSSLLLLHLENATCHISRIFDIRYTMDYSNYYLKNYYKNKNNATGGGNGENVERKILEDNPTVEEPRYYEEDGRVEIEVVPQLTSMVQTNYEIKDDDTIIDIIPQDYDRQDSKRKSWIMSLAIITCLLLTVVIGDFATNGALLAKVSSLYRTQSAPKSGFYAIVLKSSDSYSSARIAADQIRLVGGAGYIVKSGDNKYLVVGEVYDDLNEANAVVEKNEGSQLISYEIEEVDFEKIFAGNSALMQSMGGYSVAIVNQLAKIGDALSNQEIDKFTAIEQIENIRDNLQMQFDKLNEESSSDNPQVKALLSDVNVSLGLLSNLCSDNVSRPNLICDIRYTKFQLIVNYANFASKM